MIKRWFISVFVVIPLFWMFAGCSGLSVWRMGKYYQTDLTRDFQQRNIKTIGIYVFSEGSSRDGTTPAWYNIALGIPVMILSLGQIDMMTVTSFDERFFSDEITTRSSFNPDNSLEAASMRLGQEVGERLQKNGYTVRIRTVLGHNDDVTVSQCIDDALAQGFDGAFIVSYTGMHRWVKYQGTDTYIAGQTSLTVTRWTTYNGFLYLPNAALFDVKRGDRVWHSSYYGLVEGAKVLNLFAPYNETSEIAVVNEGLGNYDASAPLAAEMLFSPKFWPESFVALPDVHAGR